MDLGTHGEHGVDAQKHAEVEPKDDHELAEDQLMEEDHALDPLHPLPLVQPIHAHVMVPEDLDVTQDTLSQELDHQLLQTKLHAKTNVLLDLTANHTNMQLEAEDAKFKLLTMQPKEADTGLQDVETGCIMKKKA